MIMVIKETLSPKLFKTITKKYNKKKYNKLTKDHNKPQVWKILT